MPFYPSVYPMLSAATVRRERRLPRGAILENVSLLGAFVDPGDAVLRGLTSGTVQIINARRQLRLRPNEPLTIDMLEVIPGQKLLVDDVILTVGEGRRARQLKAPRECVFARLDGDEVLLWIDPVSIDVTALYPGRVVGADMTRAAITVETQGAVVTAAWGNGHAVYTQLRLENPEGFENLQTENLLPEFRGVAVVMKKSILTADVLSMAVQQEVTALIAPSMPVDLIQAVEDLPFPVILIDGFGINNMSDAGFAPFREHQGRPATINAANPLRDHVARPEVVITTPGGAMPVPNHDQPLKVNSQVRIAHDPYSGQTGTVRVLFDTPQVMENGLRAMAAEVQLASGRVIKVPLINLELSGRQ